MSLFGMQPNVAKLEAKRDVMGLIKALNYVKDSYVRESAARALGNLGDAQAVDALVAVLVSDLKNVRSAAAEALGQIGDTRAVKPLISILKSNAEPEKLESVAIALGKIGDKRAIPPLTDLLKNNSYLIRMGAQQALKQFGKVAVEPLILLLDDKEYKSRRTEILDILENADDARVGEALIAILKKAYLEKKQLEDEEELCEKSARILKKNGRLLRNDYQRAVLAISLGQWGEVAKFGTAAIEPISDVVKSKRHESQHLNASKTLGQIGDTRAIELLITLLLSKNDEVRNTAAQTLIDLKWQPINDAQQAILAIASNNVEEAAKLGAVAVTPLINSLHGWKGNTRNEERNRKSIRALGEVGDSRSIPILLEIVHDPKANLLWEALSALRNILKHFAANVRQEDLYSLVTLRVKYDKTYSSEPDPWGEVESYTNLKEIDCSDIQEAANQELSRRGLSV